MEWTPNKSQHTKLTLEREKHSHAPPARIRTRSLSVTSPASYTLGTQTQHEGHTEYARSRRIRNVTEHSRHKRRTRTEHGHTHSVTYTSAGFPPTVPEGRPGMSDVSPLSGISVLSFDSTSLSPHLFFCLVLLLFLSYLFFSCLLVHSPELFPENSSNIFR